MSETLTAVFSFFHPLTWAIAAFVGLIALGAWAYERYRGRQLDQLNRAIEELDEVYSHLRAKEQDLAEVHSATPQAAMPSEVQETPGESDDSRLPRSTAPLVETRASATGMRVKRASRKSGASLSSVRVLRRAELQIKGKDVFYVTDPNEDLYVIAGDLPRLL